MIIAVTGLTREARIVAGAGVTAICCGGRSVLLREKLERALAKNTAGIISIGIAGGLAPSLKSGDCVIASEIVSEGQHIPTDASWTGRLAARLPDALVAPLASSEGNGFWARRPRRICFAPPAPMPSIWSPMSRRGSPASIASHLPPCAPSPIRRRANCRPSFRERSHPRAQWIFLAVLKAVLSDPRQIPALIRTARESNAAFQALLRCRNILGLGLAGPDGSELALDM